MPSPARRVRTRRQRASWLLTLGALGLSSCYYQVSAGPAWTPAPAARFGGVASVSGGLNGAEGGVGLHATGSFFEQQASGLIGLEGFRVWRHHEHLQPYLRGGLGLLELGHYRQALMLGGLSPRAELGLLWLDSARRGLTLSAAAEYRPRTDGLSAPVFWLQLGFGGFDHLGSSAPEPR